MCGNPDRDFYPVRRICWQTAASAAFARMYDLMHADEPYHDGTFTHWSKHPSKATPFKYDDGVTVYASPVNEHPDDDFLGKPSEPVETPDDEA